MPYFSPLFAEIDAGTLDLSITPGKFLAAAILLTQILASIVMVAVWTIRWHKTGQLMPAAEHGFLRVPTLVTLVALLLGTLISVTTITAAFAPEDTSAMNHRDPDQMAAVLLQNLYFEILLVSIFGAVILIAGKEGRAFPASENEPPQITSIGDSDCTDEIPEHPRMVNRSLDDTSFSGDFRFAAEVFLATWLPTMCVRLVMIKLISVVTGEEAPSHPFIEMIEEGASWRIAGLIVLLAVVMAPALEELFYRVILVGGMSQAGFTKTGRVTSSFLFCFAHGFPDSLALLPLAFGLGYTYLRRRSYRTVFMVHFLFNSFNMILAGAMMF